MSVPSVVDEPCYVPTGAMPCCVPGAPDAAGADAAAVGAAAAAQPRQPRPR